MKPRWFRMKSAHFFRHKYMFTFLYNKPFTRYVAKIRKIFFDFIILISIFRKIYVTEEVEKERNILFEFLFLNTYIITYD